MKFELYASKWEGAIKLEFHPNGTIKTAELPEVMDLATLEWWSKHFPIYVTLLDWFRQNTNAKIVEVSSDMTFDEFWNAYKCKRGSKDIARMYWEGTKKTINKRPISASDRVEIATMLPTYTKRYSGEKNEYQPLATTFLYERLWISELERLPKATDIHISIANKIMDVWNEKPKN